jgi:hypothetical protein
MAPVLRPLSSCGLTCAAALELRFNLRGRTRIAAKPAQLPSLAHPSHLILRPGPSCAPVLRPGPTCALVFWGRPFEPTRIRPTPCRYLPEFMLPISQRVGESNGEGARLPLDSLEGLKVREYYVVMRGRTRQAKAED